MKESLNVMIVDGQGGGIGRQLVEALREAEVPCVITAVGANGTATAAMLRAGAHQGATGENAVVVCARDAEVIAGPVGIAIADSLLGEITPKMARAVGQSGALKLLLPVNHCRNIIVGAGDAALRPLIAETVSRIRALTETQD